ncbi:MAG: ATP phosphoribosyltransferase, partial [Pseudomonadota bacterium]
MKNKNITIAVPKGRILKELQPVLTKVGIIPEADFFDENSRKLQFTTNIYHINIIRVRSFDVATFVAFGAAQIGIAGSDVLQEFDFPDVYAPLDLAIGKCRLSIAGLASEEVNLTNLSHIKIATKYPNITSNYFANLGIQAECIKLSGAMELAPKLGLCSYIVDLVSSGATLLANDLSEIE